MIDFSNAKPTVTVPSTVEILKLIDESSVFGYYLGEPVRPNKGYKNPLREDKSGSCYFTWANRLRFNDSAKDKYYDLFDFVSEIRGISLQEAAKEIWQNEVAGIRYVPAASKHEFFVPNEQRLFITTKPFTKEDKEFWKQGLLTEEDLFNSDSYSIKEYIWDDKIIKPTSLCFGYYYKKQDRAKLYMPGSNLRFLSDVAPDTLDTSRVFDYSKPAFIQKSRKDRLVCDKAGIPNVFDMQAEIPTFLSDKAHEYFMRFPKVVVWWDNDEPGIEATKKLCELRNYIPFNWPSTIGSEITDAFECVKQYKTLSILTDLVKDYA